MFFRQYPLLIYYKDTVSYEIGQYGIAPKDLRKWLYNFLILNNVPESVSDFIEGRASETTESLKRPNNIKYRDLF